MSSDLLRHEKIEILLALKTALRFRLSDISGPNCQIGETELNPKNQSMYQMASGMLLGEGLIRITRIIMNGPEWVDMDYEFCFSPTGRRWLEDADV